jgi:protein O-mannosyl-transferase
MKAAYAPARKPLLTPAWVAAILISAAALAYGNSLRCPFLMDDASAIRDNRSLSLPLRWSHVFLALDAGTASGRPLLNLSFALNRMTSGPSVLGYHLVNLFIHVCSGLVLFGLVRRTLQLGRLADRVGHISTEVAGATALLWLLHPVQTEAVTYISERAESMMGLFYLLTLYAFVRATGARSRAPWLLLSVVSCLCGTATKEVMITAPLMVLLFDRAFVSDSLRSALVTRGRYYLGLASSWVLLAVLLSFNHLERRTVGLGLGVSAFDALATGAKALGIYARLAVWPSPLIFDYGREAVVGSLRTVWPQAAFVVGALAAALALWRRNPALGFLATSFFILLAPTSSVVPIVPQPIAESRMYLPLAPALLMVAVAAIRFGKRMGLGVLIFAAIGLGLLTCARNSTYASALSLWGDSVAHHPSSSRAQDNYAVELARMPGMRPAALAHFEEAIRIRPDFAEAHRDLAVELSKIPGRRDEAIAHYTRALELRPGFAEAETGLGVELGKEPGKAGEAREHLQRAVQLDAASAEAHNALAAALAKRPEGADSAIAHYQEAIRLDPDYAEAHNNLGVELATLPGRTDEALEQFREAIRIEPGYVNAQSNLAKVLARTPGRQADAVEAFNELLRIDPGSVDAHYGLGRLLLATGDRRAQGLDFVSRAAELDPRRVDIQIALANALVALPGRLAEAKTHYEAALALTPDLPEGHNGLGVVDAQTGEIDKAIEEFKRSLALRPGYREAQDNLRAMQALRR